MAKSRTVTFEADTLTVIEADGDKETRWVINPNGLKPQRAEFEGAADSATKAKIAAAIAAEDAKLK